MSISGLVARLRLLAANQLELHERRALLDRPWEEEFLHWAPDGRGWALHGRLVPPAGWRRRSVTSSGWCPGHRSHRHSAHHAAPNGRTTA